MDFPHGEPVTVLTLATQVDPYNPAERIPDPTAAPVEDHFERCAVWQERSTEPTEVGRSSVVTVTKVALPAWVCVAPGDRFRTRGSTYEVLGEPEEFSNPFTGWRPGVVITGRRVDG